MGGVIWSNIMRSARLIVRAAVPIPGSTNDDRSLPSDGLFGGREDAGWNLEGAEEEVDCAKMSVSYGLRPRLTPSYWFQVTQNRYTITGRLYHPRNNSET